MMKIIKRLLLIALLLSISLLININQVYASSATSYTLTLNAKGEFVRTQDAYLPLRTTMSLNLNKPEDMMFDQAGYLWIADTGNRRIIKYDSVTDNMVYELAYPDFLAPKGLFISSRGLYVADSAAKAVLDLIWMATLLKNLKDLILYHLEILVLNQVKLQ